jgi:hypothetical protein
MPRAVRDRPKASGKLAKIEQKIAKANERLREIEAEGRSAQAEVQRLNDALEDHSRNPITIPNRRRCSVRGPSRSNGPSSRGPRRCAGSAGSSRSWRVRPRRSSVRITAS